MAKCMKARVTHNSLFLVTGEKNLQS